MLKGILIRLVCGLVVISAFGMTASAWDPVIPQPAASGEHIQLFCDRSVYGVTEKVHFTAFYQSPRGFEDVTWSSVLYVELIRWNGTKIARAIVPIENNVARGVIRIPEELPSGNYYMRAYTRWMRNFGPTGYEYLVVKIVNPFTPDIDAGPESPGSEFQVAGNPEMGHSGDVIFTGLKEQYTRREHVEFGIALSDSLMEGPFCLSIAKTGSLASAVVPASHEVVKEGESDAVVEHLPEIGGLSLSGRILQSDSGQPVVNTKVQLSSYSNPFLYAEVCSGHDGSFLFTLPNHWDSPELHISEDSDSVEYHEILLTTEFCNRAIILPHIPFVLDETEKQVVKEILVNAQLREKYARIASEVPDSLDFSSAFYGNTALVTYVRDYIEFTSLREFITEIIPSVSVRSRNGKNGIMVHGPNCQEFYPPLVLMDNIPVPNDERLLNIPSNRIERIEVVNKGYMIGNFRYSGIFSIFSKRQDMAGITLEGDHHFFNYTFLEAGQEITPECTEEPPESAFPDIRNLLKWEPSMALSYNMAEKVRFSTSDAAGQYVISVSGTDTSGKPGILGQAVFTVGRE